MRDLKEKQVNIWPCFIIYIYEVLDEFKKWKKSQIMYADTEVTTSNMWSVCSFEERGCQQQLEEALSLWRNPNPSAGKGQAGQPPWSIMWTPRLLSGFDKSVIFLQRISDFSQMKRKVEKTPTAHTYDCEEKTKWTRSLHQPGFCSPLTFSSSTTFLGCWAKAQPTSSCSPYCPPRIYTIFIMIPS